MAIDPLSKIPLFAHLPAKERRLLSKHLVETKYKKGQLIFSEGDSADNFHFLKEGSVKCVKTGADGKQVTLKVLLPGDLFCCDAAVFNGGVHPGCAFPLEDVSVVRLDKNTYFDLLRRNPHVAVEVIQYLGQRLNEAQEKAKVLALDTAEHRMATLLVNLAERAGEKQGQTIRLTVRLTRQDLANLTGVTLETAIRMMSRFKREGFVSGTAKSLTIQNLPALRKLASDVPDRASHSVT